MTVTPGAIAWFSDFVIDGKSLTDVMKNADPGVPEQVTYIGAEFLTEYQIEYIKRLLGDLPPDLQTGRTAIYVCALDGDLMCGAVGCYIDRTKDTVIWRDFAWDDDDLEDGPDFDVENVTGLPRQYEFKRKSYEEVLTAELARLQQIKEVKLT